jgi:hypothetical protein
MKPEISAIICTHNPRGEYLNRVLEALRQQTLPMPSWELIIVDNCSNIPLSTELDVSWHPVARIISEPKLGLTQARIRGIREAASDLLLFVDDDNLLASDFLETSLKISRERPYLGAFGGLIRPEFETPPPAWTRPHLPLLAIREFERDHWSNLGYNAQTLPCGAGMVVRRFVAETYAAHCERDADRSSMDRKGSSLMSFGDTDLACTACDMGLGTGLFTALRLVHLIPSSRLEESYLLRLTEEMRFSELLFLASRREWDGDLPTSKFRSLAGKLRRRLIMSAQDRGFVEARLRGQERATEVVRGRLSANGAKAKDRI